MDLTTYEPALPELPLLRGLRFGDDAALRPRFDWASYVIRLAKAVAERDGRKPGS